MGNIEKRLKKAQLPWALSCLARNLRLYVYDHDIQGKYKEDIEEAAIVIEALSETLGCKAKEGYGEYEEECTLPEDVQTIIQNSYFMERLNGKYENENKDDQDSE